MNSPRHDVRWARSVRRLALIGGLALLASGLRAQALDEPLAFTVDLPFQDNAATPIWLGHPVIPARTFATVDFPIVPPDATSSLLVTVFFTEKEGGFMRISWQNPAGQSQTLSDNFYEGTNMSNQRSLLIAPDVLGGQGTLTLQCGDTSLSIQRVRFEWLEKKDGLVSPRIEDLLVTPMNARTINSQTLAGDQKPPEVAAWHGSIVTVPITDTPQRIEQGVEFNVQLDSVPTAGRLSLAEEGLPWGKHLVVWLNQQKAGTITPGVPDLADDGFIPDSAAANAYIGWRDGSIYLPVAFLKSGVNSLQFSVEDEVPATGSTASAPTDTPSLAPLAVKNVSVQLIFPAAIDSTVSSVSPTDSTNTPAASPPDATNAPAATAPDSTNAPASTSPITTSP